MTTTAVDTIISKGPVNTPYKSNQHIILLLFVGYLVGFDNGNKKKRQAGYIFLVILFANHLNVLMCKEKHSIYVQFYNFPTHIH